MINNMIKTKGYVLSTEVEEYVFLNENDRNEMALAIFEEEIDECFMYEYNHYGEYFEKNYIDIYGSIEEVWHWRMLVIKGTTHEHMWTYDVQIVEG